MCTTRDVGELFLDKSDELVLAFDAIMTTVMGWEPNYMGASIHSVVFTNRKAWLIVKPMKKELDIKFYYPERIDSDQIHRYVAYPNKIAHHLRVKEAYEIDQAVISLLRKGYDYALSG